MRFSKWHAHGNSYLLVEQAELDADEARRLSAEHETDGVLQVVGHDDEEAVVVIWNPDGSTAELSGNGTRIAARWLAEKTGARIVRIRVGDRLVEARVRDYDVETDLGPVTVGDPEVLELNGETVEFVPVAVGNPHAVIRGEPDAAARLGPLIEVHPRFPDRTNVQFVRVDADCELTIGIWERGAGETTASGTSAAAAAAAAVKHEWLDCAEAPVLVHMRGGDLLVELAYDHAIVTGPAERLA